MLFANIFDQMMGTCCLGFFMVMAVIIGLIVLAGKMSGGKGGGRATGESVAGKVGSAIVWKLMTIVIGIVLRKRK